MAGVMADQGHVPPEDSLPAPGGGHLKVTPENVVDLAAAFQTATDKLNAANRNVSLRLMLPIDAFLGDPYSKWAIEEFSDYFVESHDSFANTINRLVLEHKRTYNALRAAAESYGKTDELNARHLRKAYPVS